MEVLIYAETRGNDIHPVSYELLNKGREIADKLNVRLSSVILGYGIRDKCKELIYYGADRVYVYDHPSLKDFDVVLYKHNIIKLIKEVKPNIVLFGATQVGRSLAPRVAAALKTGLTADCIDLQVDDNGDLIQIRPAFTGNIIAFIKTRTKPVMSTVRYRVFNRGKRDTSRSGEIIEMEPEVFDTGIRVLGKVKDKGISLSDAEVIVSGGRGLKKPEDLKLIKQLAEVLGGVVGASRPLVDEGWISREHQVGFSGNIVKPKLYVACGISGSPQHLAGMRDSKIIVAINVDPSAPIFRYCDYGIVGDLYEVIPKLIEEVRRRLNRGES